MSRMPPDTIRPAEPRVNIGTSGYYYTDWKGHFYPDTLRKEDYLPYYRLFFDTVELNFSFYQMPVSTQLLRFADLALQPLSISMKAYRGITHEDADTELIEVFMSRVDVLIRAGILKTVLFQFPFSFRESPAGWEKLEGIVRHVHGVIPVVEFRHVSWFTPEALRRLEHLDIVVCGTDMPTLNDLPGCRLHSTHAVGYMRFHGRNAGTWWNRGDAYERYDYLYTRQELLDLVPALKKWISRHSEVYIFFNNHYRGQAVQNGQMMIAFLAD
ncbi:DUF72 domain-containing protein [bacterium]|nr:DUF72 domain-containing protein [candidate division CSSED10-310 bacterium]